MVDTGILISAAYVVLFWRAYLLEKATAGPSRGQTNPAERVSMMKKALKTLLILAISLVLLYGVFLWGFVSFLRAAGLGGAGDWACDSLPDPYEIWHINGATVVLVERDSPSGGRNVVGSFVWKSAWDEDLILVAQKPRRDSPDTESVFYAVDVASGEVFGPMDEAALETFCAEHRRNVANLSWLTLKELEKNY